MPFPFVENLIVRDEAESTNDLARELVQGPGFVLPATIRAVRQTRGRGRGNNAWWSDEGSLTFTLALDPGAHGLERHHEPRLALMCAVAIVEALGEDSPGKGQIGIRWPNDVEAQGRKLAGILPERVDGPRPRLLLGVGVNVRTRLEDAPAEVRAMATSIAELRGPGVPSVEQILWTFLQRIRAFLPLLAADDPGLAAAWARLDTLLGQPVRVRLPDRVLEGVGRGIDPEGALLVATATGVERLFGGQVLREG